VRRLKSRDAWSKIWYQRAHEDIFEANTIQTKLKIPQALKERSEHTFKKYKKVSGSLEYLQK